MAYQDSSAALQFGPFTLDLRSHELRKLQQRVPLQPIAFQALHLMLQKPGELISRGELQSSLWGQDVFIDFENSLNAAIARLRQALEDDGAAPKYIETVPRKGYRFLCEVRQTDRIESKTTHRLVLMPFLNNSGADRDNYLHHEFLEEFTISLSQENSFDLHSPETETRQITQSQNFISPAPLDVQPSYILQGSTRLIAPTCIRVGVKLAFQPDSSVLWADSFHIEEDALKTSASQLSLQITRELKKHHTKMLRSRPKEDARARIAWAQGHFYASRSNLKSYLRAIQFFSEAIEIQPNFAEAYAGLAYAYVMLADEAISGMSFSEAMRRAEAANQTALSLNPTLADAHFAQGLIYWRRDHNWNLAEQEFRTGVSLAPGNSSGRMVFSWFLVAMRRMEDAVEELRIADTIDPVSIRIKTNLGWALSRSGKPLEAINMLNSAIELDEQYALAHLILSGIYAAQGKYNEGVKEAKLAVKYSNDHSYMRSHLGHIYGMAGQTSMAQEILHELQSLSRSQFVPSYHFLLVHAGLGEREKLYNCLESAKKEGSSYLNYLDSDPLFDSYRQDTQFARLLSEVRGGNELL